ncbi:uracil-DNA glycosylase [Clostridium sp. JS66]|uniref:uracil-DNA glycosylase n=1 Tax=Clostridium sp. JS66 TaxID=3064705 RepID=UPI00298E7498|nr:uracil-DNA glycosylase [Clostridium sp. JS66]WPC43507.1 uracil-DNA glycosylase [Clostridium sp. JS66]
MTIEMVQCRKCKYYYITWDKNFPYGCKLFKVKSKQMPSIIVYQSIGKQCGNYCYNL